MTLFYQPDIANSSFLTEEDSRHAKVLRLKSGDFIQITDGLGGLFDAQIINVLDKTIKFVVTKTTLEVGKRNYKIEIALAPTKNLERIEWFVEKAVEMGIDSIRFFKSEHSERQFLKTERLHKIAVSAMKQSLQYYLPSIGELEDYATLLGSVRSNKKYIAHLPDDFVPQSLLSAALPKQTYTVLIGPEGDFTADELEKAKQFGFESVALGSTRLRTETAALTACTLLNGINW